MVRARGRVPLRLLLGADAHRAGLLPRRGPEAPDARAGGGHGRVGALPHEQPVHDRELDAKLPFC